MPQAKRTINGDDQWIEFTPAGNFLVIITGTIGSNAVEVHVWDPVTGDWTACTDGTGAKISLVAVGTIPINNPATDLKYRAGCTAASFVSGSFGLAVAHP